MPSDFLLFLPLLGGYLFSRIFHLRQFEAKAKSGHHLIFDAAGFALVFFAAARLLVVLDAETLQLQVVLKSYLAGAVAPPGVGSSLLSILLACLTASLLNLVIGYRQRWRIADSRAKGMGRWWMASRNYSQDKAIGQTGNALQKLLHRAAEAGADEGLLIALTLSSRRAYAGWVTVSPNLSPSETFVSLVPLMSGYRSESDLELKWDFAYPLDTIMDLAADETVVLALPINEIRSAHILDEGYWSREQKRLLNVSKPAQEGPTEAHGSVAPTGAAPQDPPD